MVINVEFVREVGVFRWMTRTAVRQTAKRAFGRGLTFKLPTGGTLYLPKDSVFGTEAYVTGASTDHGSEALLASLLSAGQIFLDVGANIGYYTAYMAPLVEHVYAFEPDPRSLPALERNARAAGNVTVVNKAVSDRDGLLALDVSAAPELSFASTSGLDVEAVTIDSFVAEHTLRHIGAIKIDVQGHDTAAIAGAERTLRSQQPIVLTEFDPSTVNRWSDLQALLDGLDFRAYGFVKVAARRFALQSLSQPTAKMMFLVPPRLRSTFETSVRSKDVAEATA